MGSAMDGNLLKAAASAHHQAIGSIDAAGVTSAADYASVTAALGRAIASAPTSKVMDVYNAFAGIVQPSVPNTLFSKVDPLAANAAASAFYEFRHVVKAEQRETPLDGLRAGRDGGPGGFKLMGGLCQSARRFLLWDSRRRWCTQRISVSSRAFVRF